MTYQTDIDIYHQSSVSDFLQLLEQYDNPQIISYKNFGPAGGNPTFTLQFTNYDDIYNFLTSFHSHSSDNTNFIQKQITKIL